MRCLLQSTVNIDKVVIHILKHVNSGRTNYSPIGLKSQKLTITQCLFQEKQQKTVDYLFYFPFFLATRYLFLCIQ